MANLSFSYFFFIIALLTGHQFLVECSSHHHRRHHHHRSRVGLTKLFVFGDSYAANGNDNKNVSSWFPPYGATFPGTATGRWSDGRVFSDYLAYHLKIKSPIPYRFRNAGTKHLKYGMNFAYGGTGVFVRDPNMTAQIDFLEKLIKDGVYTKQDLSSSTAYLSIAGNDYSAYVISGNVSITGFLPYMSSVVNQISVNLNRLHGLGVRKVTVTTLAPLGCLPITTAAPSYRNCNENLNTAAKFHNLLLREAVTRLNNATSGSPFAIVDLNSAFLSSFQRQGNIPGRLESDPPFKPCCVGISSKYSCGSVDEQGVKKYTVCQDPKSTFYWDSVHPTQAGWVEVYTALRPSLDQLFY